MIHIIYINIKLPRRGHTDEVQASRGTERSWFYNTKTRIFKYTENTTKIWKISDKNSDIFRLSYQNIDCGYPLEPPRRGGSNEYPQSMLLSTNNETYAYPCKP